MLLFKRSRCLYLSNCPNTTWKIEIETQKYNKQTNKQIYSNQNIFLLLL